MVGVAVLRAVLWISIAGVVGCESKQQQPAAVLQGLSTQTAMTATTGVLKPNRLIHEKSPYLLQHAYNPVDWYPWGEEAFAKAKQEQKPIFLSIGYSTCHWCHVMEHESFEQPQIAELMNRDFVSIKVDREEHPDLDHVYMSAVTALTGHGGWPLTVFLTPALQPFFGGTYFPPERRGNIPGMKELLPAIATAWAQRRQEVLTSAEQLTAVLQQAVVGPTTPTAFSLDTLHAAFAQAVASFDPVHGGFGDAPKFPRSHALSFLLHYWARTLSAGGAGPPLDSARGRQALDMVTTTLDRMAQGGIYDHVGGGFHRYSTDAQWLVPHFEKMLYDQALLARTYLEAYRVTKRSKYAQIARDILEYVLRDLTSPEGAFYAAEDADSEGEEGKFYVWTPQEITQLLGEAEASVFNQFYGIRAEGNFSAEGGPASGGEHPVSILHIEQPLPDFARLKGFEVPALAARLAAGRAKLVAARAQRIRPHRDDKILTSWNGLMIATFAYGASTLEEPRYLEAAHRAAQFILTHLRRDGRLLRRFRDGDARYAGTLEDYAFFSYGLLELYGARFEPGDLATAKDLAGQMVERFWDEEASGLFLRGKDEEPLIVRAKDSYDGATPSGNSMAALVLLRLGRLTADPRLEEYGRRTVEGLAQLVEQAPSGYPQLLIAWDFALGPTQEIVIAGHPAGQDTMQMLRVLRERFLPRAVTVLHSEGPTAQALQALVPYVQAQRPLRGQATAYVCENFICKLPTTDVNAFRDLLESTGPQEQDPS